MIPHGAVCLVTSRRPGGATAVLERLRSQVDAAVAAGLDFVHIREPELDAAALAAAVAAAVRRSRGSVTRILVNDRLDVALACGADGVHLRTDSVPPSEARSIAPRGFLIGRSVHGLDEARRVAGACDYLVAGAVFPTASKPEDTPWLGVQGLAAIASAVPVPVLAIGGLDVERAREVAAAGAAGIAAIGLFADAPASSWRAIAASIRGAFDSAGSHS